MKNLEIRMNVTDLFAGEGEEVKSELGRTLSGYALKWNTWSQVLDDEGYMFREMLKPTCATQEFLDSQDVICLLEHTTGRILGRSSKGKGTLKLTADEVGVKFVVEAPHTADGDTAVELVRRGDYSGCSFAFLPDNESVIWGRDEDGIPTRTITRFLLMSDVSIVSHPAYVQTSVSVRDRMQVDENVQDEAKKAEMKKYIAEQRKAAEDAVNKY